MISVCKCPSGCHVERRMEGNISGTSAEAIMSYFPQDLPSAHLSSSHSSPDPVNPFALIRIVGLQEKNTINLVYIK